MFSNRLYQLLTTIAVCLSSSHINCSANQAFTLDDFLSHKFSDRKWNGTWIDDDTFFYKRENGFYFFDARTNEETQFIGASALAELSNDARIQKISVDKRFALIKYNITSVFRHSTVANYAVFDVVSKKLMTSPTPNSLYKYGEFSPRNNSLIFVGLNDNNIYYHSVTDAWRYVAPFTLSGSENISHGIPDWVYEETVLHSDHAIWMSPYSAYLAFATFDNTEVPTMTFAKYGRGGSLDAQYPKMVSFKYPKVGTPNPSFIVHVYDLQIHRSIQMKLPFGNANSSEYILYDVQWNTWDSLLVTYTNRWQTTGAIVECICSTGDCDIVHELSQENAWLTIVPPHIINGTHFVYRDTSDEYDGLVIKSETTILKLSLGNMLISKIFGHRHNLLYFRGNEAQNHTQQHVYSVTMDDAAEVTCMTCNLKSSLDSYCKYGSAAFSRNLQYMTRICEGPGPAYVDLYDVDEDKVLRELETNEEVRKLLQDKDQPIVKDMMIDIPLTNFQAAVRLMLPPDFSENKTYPMVLEVYGKPESKQIKDAFSVGFEHYLVTSKKFIFASIDARGTGNRERSLTHAVYKKLGQMEVQDHISTIRILRDTFKYIDGDQICIWGWSFGGFTASMIIAKDTSRLIKCGIAVSPISSFLYYASIVTERYMGELHGNILGYIATNVDNLAVNFRNKSFMLVHGGADDNAHFQNSMFLARELQLADIPFQQITYPDEGHELKGVLKHLYHAMDAFWDQNIISTDHHHITSSAIRIVASSVFTFTVFAMVTLVIFY